MKLYKVFFIFLMTLCAGWLPPDVYGHDGEHLDKPETSHLQPNTGPRIETFTETFELVGHLEPDELSIVIDRYETNEPVLDGKLEVELNGIKALAKFHADHGDYVIDDANVLKTLAEPGKHALLFTFSAGNDHDLLEASLEVTDHAHSHDSTHFWPTRGVWIAAVAALALALAAFVTRRRRHNLLGKKTV